ncbi:sugar ABC transporter substrate-binding protein [Streptomyces armeniacus]|uniref:Sugar ABC transporter substrate-binding protein n=1 Tax=Streptomyces armeniacus TaxID=83291 RepID=A0A345XV41_9ACTN|nr:sugar ABC transporter substrate-binding protein [Streptomyces armeniacus]AXK35507.1 sugar ABC transporter substrate-binding protein [Streptomyces armeniacus]
MTVDSTRGVPRRRVLAGGAAAAGTAALAGCGLQAKAEGGPMQFWNFYAPQRSDDPALAAQSKWFTDLVAKWNASHKTKIELLYLPPPIYQTGSKLPTAFAAGSGPDIFLASPGDFLRYYNGGILMDLTPHMDKAAVKDYYKDALASRMVDGKVYALPMEVEPLAMYYDVSAWEKAKLSEGDIPTTWDQLLDVGAKLKSPTRAGIVTETKPGYLQNFLWYPWMWQGGGDVLDEKGRPSVDTKAVRQALQLWQDAVRLGITPRVPPAANDLIAAFRGGNAAMWQSGIWQVSSFRAFAPKFEYGLFKLPTPPGGTYKTALGGWSFCANAKGRHPEAAAEFCAWALGTMEEECLDRMVDWCVKAKSDIAPRKSVLERATRAGGYDQWAMKYFKDEVFPGGRAEPRYPPVIYKAMSDALQGAMLAGRSVDSETSRAAQSVEAYVKSYKGAKLV